MEKSLRISEKLYFLSIRREKGGLSMSASSQIHIVVHGALLIEMLHKSILDIANGKISVRESRDEDEIYSYILGLWGNIQNPRRIRFWLSRMSTKRVRIKRLLHARMEKKRLISIEKKQFLFIKWEKPHILDYKMHRELNRRVSNAIFSNELNKEELIELILLKSLNILRNIFSEKENRRQARRKLKALSVNPPITQGEKDIVLGINRAIRAAHAAAAAGAS